jgi:hypothetical protein
VGQCCVGGPLSLSIHGVGSVPACSRAGGVLGLGLLHCLVAAGQCNGTGLKGAMRITLPKFRACV